MTPPAPLGLLPPLLDGLGVTLVLTGASAVLASLCALVAGVARTSRRPWLRAPVRAYVELFRGTSALVQLFWVYFALPLVGIDLGARTAAILVLGLNTGAYGSEVVRGAIRAVPRGQWDAAVALGLGRGPTLRHVLLPQALVAALPPAANLAVELLKNTALVSLVTVADLTFEAQVLRSATLRSGEIFGLILVLYFAVAMAIVAGLRHLERRLGRGLAPGGASA